MTEFFLGIDSTDSPRGGCTTHVAALAVERILRTEGEFLDYPHLVRLNPNVPYKTRGNGALSLHFQLRGAFRERLLDEVEHIITNEADLPHESSDPGLVLLEGPVPVEVKLFANRCLHDLVPLEDAERLIREQRICARRWKKGRGLVGALASTGLDLPSDYIFELIAYRSRQNYGKPRLVDSDSVRRMDTATGPYTINNVDYETHRILITPRGPDPVLLGIRGESPEILMKAFAMLSIGEEVERWLIFRSNECTDSHLRPVAAISELRPDTSAIVHGTIDEKPQVIPGGHVFTVITDSTGRIPIAAFEPTGKFRGIIQNLVSGDEVVAYGGVKRSSVGDGLTLNLEGITISRLIRAVSGNPFCEECGVRMESMGSNQGHRCRKCKRRLRFGAKSTYPLKRNVMEGVLYQPPPRAHRHLTRPVARLLKGVKPEPPLMVPGWCSPAYP